MPVCRIGTVETSDKNKIDVKDVKDEFVMKRRLGMFWNFLILKFRLSTDYFPEMQRTAIFDQKREEKHNERERRTNKSRKKREKMESLIVTSPHDKARK